MALLAISYDLRAPGRNYDLLWRQLESWRAVRLLESLWVVNLNATAKTAWAHLSQLLDTNDQLVVIEQSPAAGAAGVCRPDGADWLNRHLQTV